MGRPTPQPKLNLVQNTAPDQKKANFERRMRHTTADYAYIKWTVKNNNVCTGYLQQLGEQDRIGETQRNRHLCNGFSSTTWVSLYQKGKPFSILIKLEMTRWQWHQLNFTQIDFHFSRTDNHANTSWLNFTDLTSTEQCQRTKGRSPDSSKWTKIIHCRNKIEFHEYRTICLLRKRTRFCIYIFGPILWGHSGPLCHALSLLLLLWTSMRMQAACDSSDIWWMAM